MQLFTQPPQKNFNPVVIPQDVPVYRIGDGKFYCDDVLYEEGSMIVWEETPSMTMEPLNELAFKAKQEHLEALDVLGRAAAEKAGKGYVSMADAFVNSMALAKEEGKRVTLLNGREETPILGKRKRGRPRIREITVPKAEKAVGTNGPLSLDGRAAVNAVSDTGL